MQRALADFLADGYSPAMSREDREKRQAEALKANLRRRKAQARAQAAGPPAAEPAPQNPQPAESEPPHHG